MKTSRYHVLKTHPQQYQAIKELRKKFEWRRDDRSPRFEVGDLLKLVEFDPKLNSVTGRSMVVEVKYTLRDEYDVPHGFVIMSIEVIS